MKDDLQLAANPREKSGVSCSDVKKKQKTKERNARQAMTVVKRAHVLRLTFQGLMILGARTYRVVLFANSYCRRWLLMLCGEDG